MRTLYDAAVVVVGVDGYRKGWVAVRLVDGRFGGAFVRPALSQIASEASAVSAIAVDIPIGLPEPGQTRSADRAAREFLRPRASVVFATPSRAVVEAQDYDEARRLHPGTTRQAFALVAKIREADAVAPADERMHEVHPEVSFRALSGLVLPPKKTWAGFHARIEALSAVGIVLPGDLPAAGVAAVDDVVDAAGAAWSADRIARGVAETLPAGSRERIGPIWY
jgi:predicted RNase H-like nuclease